MFEEYLKVSQTLPHAHNCLVGKGVASWKMAAWFWQYLYIFIVYYAFMVPQILSRAFVLRRLLINQRYKELLYNNSPPSCDVKQSRLNTFFKFAPSFPRRFHWWKNIMSRVYALNYSSKVHCFRFGKKYKSLLSRTINYQTVALLHSLLYSCFIKVLCHHEKSYIF